MTKKEVVDLLTKIKTAYERFEITPEKIDLWCEFLADHDTDKVNTCLNRHIASEKFAPTIADVTNGGDTRKRVDNTPDYLKGV